MTRIVRKGQSKKSMNRTHYSREELRLVAVEEEGRIAYRNGIAKDQNPKVSEASRNAWERGWDFEYCNS